MPPSRLKTLFSPTRRQAGHDRLVLTTGGLFGSMEWVVPRADCHYRRIDLGALPARQRFSAAAIAARRLEPTSQARSQVAWVGGFAHIWTWVAPDPGIEPEARWIPESLLKAAPLVDGPRLLRAIRGVEGQVWMEGQMQASQWWPERPSNEDWHRFLRFAGVAQTPSNNDVPVPSDLPWQAAPWGDVRRGAGISPASFERLAWPIGLGALALALGWQLAVQAKWSAAQEQQRARIESLRSSAASLLDARERADAAQADITEYRRLQWAFDDYVLMTDIDAALPDEARLVGWQREGAKLKAGLQSQDADPRHFVAAFVKHPTLSQLQAAPATETGVMSLDFILPAPPAPPAAEAGDDGREPRS